MRIGFVEWPEGLLARGEQWDWVRESVCTLQPHILVTNELPFGPWLAENAFFCKDEAQLSIRAHEEGLEALVEVDIPAVISSRPVWNGERLVNEAFVLENGAVRPLHRKQYFPNEPGWFESEWYSGDCSGFHVAEILGTRIGVLLCTEAMFNERARAYGRQQASLIVIPRASGLNIESWKTAGAMASLVSGSYVVSSNRFGCSRNGTRFGGGGFAYAPQAHLLGTTSHAKPVRTFDLDPNIPAIAQREYPCYVAELE